MEGSAQRHKEAQANYDRLSRWYDLLAESSEKPFRDQGIAELELGPDQSVLDIGAGTGDGLAQMAQQIGSGGRILGLDISQGMLAQAQQRLDRLQLPVRPRLIQGDATSLPIRTAALDAILMSFALELFQPTEMPIVLGECHRVLRPGGKLAVVSLSEGKGGNLVTRLYSWAHKTWPHIVDCRPIEVRRIVQEAGFHELNAVFGSMWGLGVAIVVAQTDTVDSSEERG